MAIRKRNSQEAVAAKDLLNKMNSTAAKVRLGEVLDCQVGVVKAKYDFAVQGGDVGTKNLLDPVDMLSTVVLPDNAIITKAYIDILTAIVSTGNNGTLALTAQSAGDLLAAVDGDTLSGIAACVPDGAVANMIKLTAERTLTMTIATNAFTAGKFVLVVEYIVTE